MAAAKKKGRTAETVFGICEPLAEALGLRIWDVIYKKEGADWLLRVFIDKDDGIGIDDCVNMTQALNPELDRLDPIPQEYTLEVSSPGINRRLTRPMHFKQYIGCPVTVRLIRALEDGRKELSGILLEACDGGDFTIQMDEEQTATFEKKECAYVMLADDSELPDEIDLDIE